MNGSDGTGSADTPVRMWFSFHGEGAEYFRIWIVNLVLTILTLGIYSAWAKVRTKRYFYGNTEMGGDRFEYLASPIMILKGRLIAVAVLILYSVALEAFSLELTLVFTLLSVIALPFIMVRALRFNALMSSWRGVRFRYDGTPRGAVFAFLLWPLFGLLTLGFGMPYVWYKQNHFMIDNYRFGTSVARSTATAGDFYLIFFAILGIGLGAGVFTVAFDVIDGFLSENIAVIEPFYFFIYVAYQVLHFLSENIAVIGLFFFFIYVVYQALHFKVVYDNISLDENEIHNSVTLMGWFTVVLVNALMMMVSMGLFYPWARVRLTRYMLSNLWVETQDIDSFIAHGQGVDSALGEEISEVFDLGVGI